MPALTPGRMALLSPPSLSPARTWDGADWAGRTVRVWNGSQWTPATARSWDGAAWTPSTAVFTPASVPGLTVWFDASDDSTFTYSSGVVVSQWRDKSGNAFHVSQATDAQRPTRSTTINGRAAVAFNGSQFLIREPATGMPSGAAARTTITVARVTSTPGPYNHIVMWGLNGTNGSLHGWGVAPGATSSLRIHLWSATLDHPTATVPPSSPHVIIARYDGANASIAANAGIAFEAARGLNTATDQLVVGARTVPGTGAEAWNGAIAEVLVYNRALTSAEQSDLYDHLRTKWGTP